MGVLVVFAVYNAIELLLELFGEGIGTVADGDAVDLGHAGHAGGGAGEEDFVCAVEFGAGNGSFGNRDAEVFGDLNDALARNAFENIIGDGRGDEGAVAHDKEVFGRTLHGVAVLIENNGFVEAERLCFVFGERGVDVGAAYFEMRGDGVVFGACPATYFAAEAVGGNVRANGE